MTGLNAVIGSWNTVPTLPPRTWRSRAGVAPSSSSPCSRTLPVTVAPAGRSPSVDMAVTLLPEPDSPTRARTRPRVEVEADPVDDLGCAPLRGRPCR